MKRSPDIKRVLSVFALLLVVCVLSASCKDKEREIITDDEEETNVGAYIIELSSSQPPELAPNYEELLPYHFYGICWRGKIDDNLKFARQMGYKYVFYQSGMENSSLAKDLNFYLESPEYQACSILGVSRTINTTKQYSQSQINTYQSYFALKNANVTFPDNMATGWWFSGESFSVEPDLQQQHVIDFFVDGAMKLAKNKERADKNFLYAGLAWDVPELTGDFWGGGKQVTLAYWTGKDSSLKLEGTTHEYETYSQARTAYFNAVKEAGEKAFPGRILKYIYEPYRPKPFIQTIEGQGSGAIEMISKNGFFSQEQGVSATTSGIDFVDDESIFQPGIIKKVQMGSSTPGNHYLDENRKIAAKAAMNGAWFNWYGRFSGSGDNVPMNNIYEVPNWLQLIRVIPNWDNLCGIPLEKRHWDGNIYESPNSRIDDHVVYSRQPETQKLFVVFLDDKGEVLLNPGEKVVSIKKVDAYFCETSDGTNELEVKGNIISIKK